MQGVEGLRAAYPPQEEGMALATMDGCYIWGSRMERQVMRKEEDATGTIWNLRVLKRQISRLPRPLLFKWSVAQGTPLDASM